jgi:hypothetical protein
MYDVFSAKSRHRKDEELNEVRAGNKETKEEEN